MNLNEGEQSGFLICIRFGSCEVRRLTRALASSKDPYQYSPCYRNDIEDILLDEVEHDSDNYQGQSLCYLPRPKAEANNTNWGLDNYRYHAKTESNNCFIMHIPEPHL